MSPIIDFKYYNKSKLRTIYEILFSNSGSAVFLFRLASWFYKRKLKVIAHLLSILNTFLNGIEIAYTANIGPGFIIYHPVGVVLGRVTAGKEFSVYQNSTAGMNHKTAEDGQQFPIFGDGVTLYSGAVVAGPITVGDNARIGANVAVFEDISDNTTVVNERPTFIKREVI